MKSLKPKRSTAKRPDRKYPKTRAKGKAARTVRDPGRHS